MIPLIPFLVSASLLWHTPEPSWSLHSALSYQSRIRPDGVADAAGGETVLSIGPDDNVPHRQYMIEGNTRVVVTGSAHSISFNGSGTITSLTVSGTGNEVRVLALVQRVVLSGSSNKVMVAAFKNPTDPIIEQTGDGNTCHVVGR